MDHDHRPAVLVVTLVVLAGCGAAPFGGGSVPTPEETLTPVPVSPTTDQPRTSIPTDRPPGVSADGYVDGAQLSSAHEAAIENRSYTWVLTYDVTGPTESEIVFDQGFRRRALVDGDRFLVTQSEYGEPVNQSLFVDGPRGYLRLADGDQTRFETVRDPGPGGEYAVGSQLVRRFLSGMHPNVTRVQRDGRTYYRLHAGTGLPMALERPGTGIRDYRVTAYVTPEGFVRSVGVSYERTWDSGIERISIRFDYSALGSTTVETPAWIDEISFETPTPAPTPETPTPTPTPTPPPVSVTTVEPPSTTGTAVNGTTATETASSTAVSAPTATGEPD